MKFLKSALLAATVLFGTLAFGQTTASRYDNFVWAGNNGNVSVIANAQVNFCSYPANAVPCTNYATAYTDVTAGTACNGSNGCANPTTSDSGGNFGAWLLPGHYVYTITYRGTSYGPYDITPGGTGSGGGVALSNTSPWTALQTFNAGITGTGDTGSLHAGVGITGQAQTWAQQATFQNGIVTNTLNASTSVTSPTYIASGTNGGVSFTEGNGSALTNGAGVCNLWGDSVTNQMGYNCNNQGNIFLAGPTYNVIFMTASGGLSPASATTYYFGPLNHGAKTTIGSSSYWNVEQACNIKSITYFSSVGGTLDTAANALTFSLDKNSGTAVSSTSNATIVENTGLSQVTITPGTSLAQGDQVRVKVVTPTFTTLPTTVIWGARVVCQ